jgi:hypothetical protein
LNRDFRIEEEKGGWVGKRKQLGTGEVNNVEKLRIKLAKDEGDETTRREWHRLNKGTTTNKNTCVILKKNLKGKSRRIKTPMPQFLTRATKGIRSKKNSYSPI